MVGQAKTLAAKFKVPVFATENKGLTGSASVALIDTEGKSMTGHTDTDLNADTLAGIGYTGKPFIR